jgi:hypothetical protein
VVRTSFLEKGQPPVDAFTHSTPPQNTPKFDNFEYFSLIEFLRYGLKN